MAKSIPAKEFKAAIKSLNVVIKTEKETPIKIVGVKKEQVIDDFTNVVLKYISEDRSDELPDEVIDLYNEYIASDDEDEPEEKAPAKGKAKGKGAAAKDKKDAPKKKGPKTKSVVELTVDLFMKNQSLTNAQIVTKLEKKFPERNIASTVSSAMCVLKHVQKHLVE